MRLTSLTSRLLVLLTALILIGLAGSIYAATPGSTGSQSAATLGIKVNIPSTIRARTVGQAGKAIENSGRYRSTYTEDFLCVTLNNTHQVSVYVLPVNTNRFVAGPDNFWLADATSNSGHRKSTGCDIRVSLDIPASRTTTNTPVTLIIAPE